MTRNFIHRLFVAILLIGSLLILPFASKAQAVECKTVPLIFDTDMGNDIDDAMALAIIHSFISRNEADLLAVTLTKSSPRAADYVRLVNQFYGRPEIPIGVAKDGKTPDDGRYLGKIFELTDENGQKLFTLPEPMEIPDAVTVLRKALAGAEDHSVVIVQVGFSTNLAALLDSPADDISPLTGKELAAKKVSVVEAMFGSFKPGSDHREYNVVTDIPAAQKLVNEWPTEIHFSGFEIGDAILMTPSCMKHDFNYVAAHPIKEGYRLYRGDLDAFQPTFDLTSVLNAVRPYRDYFDYSEMGTVTVTDEGLTHFTPDKNGRHCYFLVTPEQIVRVQEAFICLTSQPPQKSK